MARIIISRSSEYVNRLRGYKVILDGEEVGLIKNGKTLELNAEPGIHTIKVTVDWCSSQEISFAIANNDDTQYFFTSAFKNARIILPAVVVTNGACMVAGDKIPEYLSLSAPLITLAGVAYLLTFGRKKYLTLTKVTDGEFM